MIISALLTIVGIGILCYLSLRHLENETDHGNYVLFRSKRQRPPLI